MSSRAITPEKQSEVMALLGQGKPIKEISDITGVSTGKISYMKAENPPVTAWTEEKDKATYTGVTTRPVKSVEDALKVAQADPDVWYPHKIKCSQWTVPVKVSDGKVKRAIQTQQYMVRIEFERIISRSLKMAQDAVFERMKKHAPIYPTAFKPKPPKRGYLAVMGLFDVHFGKLAWGRETSSSYDLKIAERLYLNAVDDLIAETQGKPISRWLLPLGNDFYHMDNAKNTTTNGTPQDVDGRYGKVIEAGEIAVIKAIERMMTKAPVDVIWIPGNHDQTTSFHLARTVRAWFRNVDAVMVDVEPAPRKYFSYGKNLIGLTHGDSEKHEFLPNIMAQERRPEWSQAACTEWLIGHMHRTRSWVTKNVDQHQGTVVRVLKSLSGTDSWHFRKGYVGGQQAAEVYFYAHDGWYAGHGVVAARLK